MKGITPVITTVLLLLMAVAAVGGAWVWYQRMQTSAMAGGSGQVDQLRKTATSLSVDKLECSGAEYSLTMANIGTDSATLTNLTMEDSSGNIDAYKESWTVSANTLDTNTLTNTSSVSPCTTGVTYKISARIGAQYVIRDYPITVE